jgi:hypothetical protein
MALTSLHQAVLDLLEQASMLKNLAIVLTQTHDGKPRAVLCLVVTHGSDDVYVPLAVVLDDAGSELVESLHWPKLACRVALIGQVGDLGACQ